jgi:benzoyl-CoA reductase subunit C
MEGSDMSTKLTELAASIMNPYVEEWKGQGKPAVGYICSYIPKEVIHAAGILPYRVGARGCASTDEADVWMAPITCSFARCCLEMALKGEYDFLDGLISMNTCECMRRMCDNWTHTVGMPYSYYMSVPYKSDEGAIDFFEEDLHLFQGSLEKHFGASITDESLENSIQVSNETRRLLRKLHEMRKREAPPLTGTEIQKIAILSTAMPPEAYNLLLEAFLDEVDAREGITGHQARLMVIGSPMDDTRLTETIEEFGGLIVTDATCYGAYSYWDSIEAAGNPWRSVASYYLKRPGCPRMPQKSGDRLAYIGEMAKAFEVDGIIFERMLFCNLWGGETLPLEEGLQEMEIPLLVLDREYIPGAVGQLRTRLQAFIEMIKGV